MDSHVARMREKIKSYSLENYTNQFELKTIDVWKYILKTRLGI
jgi:hypothetical protein